MKIAAGVQADRRILVEFRDDKDVPGWHIILLPEEARTLADQLYKLAEISEGLHVGTNSR